MRLKLCCCVLFLASLTACQTVRTVYDEGGNVVKEDGSEGARESDLLAAYEKRFDESFSEKKNAQGVPEAKSRRVSAFQRELDSARDTDNPYATKSFGGLKESGLRSRSYGATKVYSGGKAYEGSRTQSAITRDMRPDFMNENHGIAHEDYKGSRGRSSLEGSYTEDYSDSYGTKSSSYRRDQESGYFESLRDQTPAPPIYDHRDTQTRDIMNIRNILGRDKTDAQE